MSKKNSIQVDERTYQTLVELINSIRLLQDYLNDQVTHDMSKHLGVIFKLLNGLSATEVVDILERGLQDPQLDKTLVEDSKQGLVG